MSDNRTARALVSTCSQAALAYAWCKVCFTAWDATLEAAGENVLKYSKWPSALRSLSVRRVNSEQRSRSIATGQTGMKLPLLMDRRLSNRSSRSRIGA